MFTDQPVTPGRLETLLDLVRARPGLTRAEAMALLQPATVHQDRRRVQSKETISAALALHLIEEDDHKCLQAVGGGDLGIRDQVLQALDREVLGKDDVEPYFAPFYAFMLGSPRKRSRLEWVEDFNRAVYGEKLPGDPFNPTKLSGFWRWLTYVGLGWIDPADEFQPLPSERVRRHLPAIFAGDRKLEDGLFMERLARCCPELDGGRIFAAVHREADRDEACTAGLAAALIELHLEGVLCLHAPRDAKGWSIAAAEPTPDGQTLMGDRLQAVELGAASSGRTGDA